MAAAKRYTAEQIVSKLREAEKLQAQGATIPQVCKKAGVLVQTVPTSSAAALDVGASGSSQVPVTLIGNTRRWVPDPGVRSTWPNAMWIWPSGRKRREAVVTAKK
jgi:hypothetical protein